MDLTNTLDARDWATEFMRIWKDKTPEHDDMVGWFANAIEFGRIDGEKKARIACAPRHYGGTR